MPEFITLHRTGVLNRRMRIRKCQQHRFLHDFVAHRIRKLLQEVGNHKVDRILLKHLLQIRDDDIVENKFHIRITRLKPRQYLRHHRNRSSLLDTDANRRLLLLPLPLHLQHLLRPLYILLPDRRQHASLFLPHTLKQRYAEVLLEITDIHTQRRRRDKQRLRRP